jgi:carbamoyl-phosphate synthase large subunit
VKSLRIAPFPVTVVSADIAPLNAALYRADEAALIPRVEDPDALERIIAILRAKKIDVVLIGSEFELEFFSQNREIIQSTSGTVVVVAPPRTVAIANDKWLTAEFLRENGLPYAESSLPRSIDEAVSLAREWGFPLVVKPRGGTSSRHVYITRTMGELRSAWPVTPNPMLQRVVDIPSAELHNEYTCSVFRTASGVMLGPFHARRTLRGGTSWLIEVCRFPHLDELLLGIGQRLDFPGTLNVQLMIGVDGPVPFEFNARFSGTTAVRAHFGFNEPALAIQSYFFNEEPKPPTIRSGVAMRYNEEVFIENTIAAEVTPDVSRGQVRPWF